MSVALDRSTAGRVAPPDRTPGWRRDMWRPGGFSIRLRRYGNGSTACPGLVGKRWPLPKPGICITPPAGPLAPGDRVSVGDRRRTDFHGPGQRVRESGGVGYLQAAVAAAWRLFETAAIGSLAGGPARELPGP